ncbi:MAG TPA: hypothetical protein VMV92_33635 [Streptosporangiaceae bacterium]|nr:hypothetical protein [Streptosporangiaceae bacterium]
MQDAFTIDCKQVDDLHGARRDLAPDDKQWFPEDRRLSLDQLFQASLGRHTPLDQPHWIVIYAPQAHLNRHSRPSASHS